MSFETLNARTRKLLEDAGIKTAVQALQAGKDGLTDISGIGEATADQILAAASAELAGAAGATPAPQEPTPDESDVSTPNEDSADDSEGTNKTGDLTDESKSNEGPVEDEPSKEDEDEPSKEDEAQPVYEDWADRPTEVVLRLNTLASAILGGSRILQGESRRVPFAQFETAVADYPGAWLVRFDRDGEFEVA